MERSLQISFNASGKASFLRHSTESGSLGSRDCVIFSGNSTLASARHSRDTIEVALSGEIFVLHGCFSTKAQYTVTGGTGRFAHATGSGSFRFKCGSTRSDTYTGTITF